MITCNELSRISGWHCSPAPDGSLHISSPVILQDGTPLGFFVSQEWDRIDVSDEGMIIFSLRNQGIDLYDRRNWRSLDIITSRLGFTLNDSGEIGGSFSVKDSAFWFSNLTRLLGAIADWQQEQIDFDDVDFQLTQDVEALLRAKAPDRHLQIAPAIKIKNSRITFNFLWGDTYVDAIPPKARVVSARMRKAAIAQGLELKGFNVLFIVDDRSDPAKAREEVALLAQLSDAKTYSNFERQPIAA